MVDPGDRRLLRYADHHRHQPGLDTALPQHQDNQRCTEVSQTYTVLFLYCLLLPFLLYFYFFASSIFFVYFCFLFYCFFLIIYFFSLFFLPFLFLLLFFIFFFFFFFVFFFFFFFFFFCVLIVLYSIYSVTLHRFVSVANRKRRCKLALLPANSLS